jgi:iron complex transport system substrate-binding protein
LFQWRAASFGVILAFILSSFAYSYSDSIDILQVEDDIGDKILFDAPASRIISLYPGHTENIIAIGAGDLLVATGQGDDGTGPGRIPSLGARPGVEQIMALKPDLVLSRPMYVRGQPALYSRLRSLGVRVLALDPPTWDKFPAYVDLLARVAGVASEPRAEVADELSALGAEALSADAGRAGRGVILVTVGRTMSTCTPDSWAAHILRSAGFRNVAAGARPVSKGSVIAPFGAERLLASDSEVDVILLQQGAMNSTGAAEFVRDSRFSGLKAVRNGMVFDVSEADISRPSLLRLRRGVVGALRELAADRGELNGTDG